MVRKKTTTPRKQKSTWKKEENHNTNINLAVRCNKAAFVCTHLHFVRWFCSFSLIYIFFMLFFSFATLSFAQPFTSIWTLNGVSQCVFWNLHSPQLHHTRFKCITTVAAIFGGQIKNKHETFMSNINILSTRKLKFKWNHLMWSAPAIFGMKTI